MINKIDENLLEKFGYKKYKVPEWYSCNEFWQKRLYVSEENFITIDIKIYYPINDKKYGYEFETQLEAPDDNAFNTNTCQWYRPGHMLYNEEELLRKVDKFFTALYIFSKTVQI